jgi:glycosyltransferase involved in cell wall biosynthesis
LRLIATREGLPYVALESLASGTPVVAVDVGAVGEMLTSGAVGRIVGSRAAADLAGAVEDQMRSRSDRDRVREHAVQFNGSAISKGKWDFVTRAMREPSDQLAVSVASTQSGR